MTEDSDCKAVNHHKIPASMTVEASYIMAMVILCLAVLIRTAYDQCGKATKVMNLHYIVEQLRWREEEQSRTLKQGCVNRDSEQVDGYIDGRTWRKEITVELYEPEKILREMAVFERHSEVREE